MVWPFVDAHLLLLLLLFGYHLHISPRKNPLHILDVVQSGLHLVLETLVLLALVQQIV